MLSTKIEGAFILCMDHNRRSIRDGAILIEGNTIKRLGLKAEMKNMKADRTISLPNHVILPGFVNTHCHLQQYYRGVYEQIGDFYRVNLPLEGYRAPGHMKKLALSMCAEFLWGGCTTLQTVYTYPEDFAAAVEKTGLRALLSSDIEQVNLESLQRNEYLYDERKGDVAYKRAEDFFSRWHGRADGRIKVCMTPKAVDLVSLEMLQRVRNFAEKNDTRITMHLAQSYREINQVYKTYSQSPVQVLNSLGMLNDRLSVAHFAYADEVDTLLLSEKKVGISQCRFLNSPVQRWLDLGIKVGLGTDDDYHNMIALIRDVMFGQKDRAYLVKGSEGIQPETRSAMKPRAYDLLEMATRKGAEVLGMDKEIGSLEIGKKADIIAVSMDSPHLSPCHDPVVSLVYYGSSADVDTVIIDGKVVKERGTLTTIDLRQARVEAQEQAEDIMASFFHDHPQEGCLWRARTDYLHHTLLEQHGGKNGSTNS